MMKLVKRICPKCKRVVLETFANADVYCPKCKKWIKGEKK